MARWNSTDNGAIYSLSAPGTPFMTQPLILLGAGHAHVHVLAQLARHPLADTDVTLIAPHPRQLYSGMVPGFVAGHYTLDDCTIPLEPLVKASGVRWLARQVVAMDAHARTVRLDDGSELGYEWLSINTGPVQLREQIEARMPGACEFGLFVRPIEMFGNLWPSVTERGATQALRISVIGAGAAGVELAMAMRHALPVAAVTLITGGGPAASGYAPALQRLVAAALKQRAVTVLCDTAESLGRGELLLGSGARLACDVPVIATGAQAPAWVQGSGLALDAQGFVKVNACLRTISHPNVFAAGDVATRVDRAIPRSGVYAVRAGPALAANLGAATSGAQLLAHQPPQRSLNLLSCGDGHAIASWGTFAAQGRWAWWLKDRIDRGFIARYRTM